MKNLSKTLIIAFIMLSFMSKKSRDINVVIDAGHGGNDKGAVGNNLVEKEITSQIAQRIKELNTNANVKIHFTKNDDTFMSLADRADLINSFRPDFVISLHINMSENPAAKGAQAIVNNLGENAEASKTIATKLVAYFCEKNNLQNRGIQLMPFQLLKKTKVPAMLLEMGYISNPNDAAYMGSKEGKTKMAQTIVDFINEIE